MRITDELDTAGARVHVKIMDYIVGFLFLLVCILAMAAGSVLFKRKPIQHCGGSSISYKGESIDCPVCQGCEMDCEKAGKRPAVASGK